MVRYTVADGVRWADGVVIEAADLLFNWAAPSGVFNEPQLARADAFEGDTAQYSTDFDDDAFCFDTGMNFERPRGAPTRWHHVATVQGLRVDHA